MTLWNIFLSILYFERRNLLPNRSEMSLSSYKVIRSHVEYVNHSYSSRVVTLSMQSLGCYRLQSTVRIKTLEHVPNGVRKGVIAHLLISAPRASSPRSILFTNNKHNAPITSLEQRRCPSFTLPIMIASEAPNNLCSLTLRALNVEAQSE